MHSLGQKVLITNSIKNKERNDMYSETCFINRYHGCFFAAVEIEQVNQVKMFARMFLRRSIEDMQQKIQQSLLTFLCFLARCGMMARYFMFKVGDITTFPTRRLKQ